MAQCMEFFVYSHILKAVNHLVFHNQYEWGSMQGCLRRTSASVTAIGVDGDGPSNFE
jgi:hypothetical protein